MSAAPTPAQTTVLSSDDITDTVSHMPITGFAPVKRMRKLLSGKRTTEEQRYWGFEEAAGTRRRGGTGGAKANPEHPSRKHDVVDEHVVIVTPHDQVPGPVLGQPSRRERRPALIKARKEAAKAARAQRVDA